MKENKRGTWRSALLWVAVFILWTGLIQIIDVKPVGPRESAVGLATLNIWVHNTIGVHMILYTITDWLELVPFIICISFGILGLAQWIKRKKLVKVDKDILFLGIYYIVVILAYLLFEMIPINYRPVLIDGLLEASYPSSTTLLVLCVMPTVIFQSERRVQNRTVRYAIKILVVLFSAFMVVGRMISGVHWFTDILGAVFLSKGLYTLYCALVLLTERPERWGV